MGRFAEKKWRMELERYEVSASEDFLIFTFVSEGPRGKIKKRVKFEKIVGPLYNIGLSDVDEQTGETSDSVVTNNNDTRKILITIASIVYYFFEQHPDFSLIIRGNTHSRSRLFRRAINLYWDRISKDFNVLGQTDEGWERFNFDEDYVAFLIQTT